MSFSRYFPILSVLLAAMLVLAACVPSAGPAPDTAAATPRVTTGVEPASSPTSVPTEEVGLPSAPVQKSDGEGGVGGDANDQDRFPEPVLEAVANEFNVQLEELQITSFQRVDWPDACLGVSNKDQMCADVITPGYLIHLEVTGQPYEVHTDVSGFRVVVVDKRSGSQELPVMKWQHDMDGVCQSAVIGMGGVAFGPCEGQLTETPFSSEDRLAELQSFINRFAPFESDTLAGSVVFGGQGQLRPTNAQQRMIAEWARLVVLESSGQADDESGVIFIWQRNGGIAGFCDTVKVYTTGTVEVSSCKDANSPPARILLTANQLITVYNWAGNFKDFEIRDEGNPEFSDNMTVWLVFHGNGSIEPNQGDVAGIQDLAQEFVLQAALEPTAEDIASAQRALEGYLSLLATRNYAGAAGLYAGSYEGLAGMNPDIDPANEAALFEAGCKYNGYICSLTLKDIVNIAPLSENRFRFTVELQKPDGTLFSMGPCCGASPEEQPPQTQFDFVVEKIDGVFMVTDLPIYTP